MVWHTISCCGPRIICVTDFLIFRVPCPLRFGIFRLGVLPNREQERGVTGEIRSYFPKSRRGILQTDSGEELVFTVRHDHVELEGGDRVDFELSPDGRLPTLNIIARRRWVDTLNQEHRSLVNQFHNTIQIVA